MHIADSKHMSVFFTRTGIEFISVCPSCHIYPFIEIDFVEGGEASCRRTSSSAVLACLHVCPSVL